MVSVLAGIENILSETNYDIIIAHSRESGKKEMANASNLFHKRVDGLIASLAFDTPNLAHFNQFINKKYRWFFDRVEENSGGSKVIIDNYKAGYDATNHLIEQGCKRIVHVTGSLSRNVYIKRFEGYKAALKAHDIKFKEQYLIEGTLEKESAIEAAKKIANMKPMPDGLFITNDFSAAVCIQTLKEAGIKIPEDIAVVGFNNDVISTIIEPHLTTIDYPGVNVGKTAARQLLQQLKGEGNNADTHTIVLRSELIVRASSLKKNNPMHKTAIVTGGGSGLGFAIASKLVAADIQTIIIGRDINKLNEAKKALGDLCYTIAADLKDTKALPALVSNMITSFGRIDILINNAGINLKKPFTEVTDDEFENILQTNVTAMFALSREVVKHMIANKQGAIVNISSMASQYGLPKVIAYTASKGAIEAMTRAMAVELSPDGIRVNCIAPGFIYSAMSAKALDSDPERKAKVFGRTPMGIMGQPADIADAAAFLVSDEAKYITGVILPVDGGNSIGF